MHPGWGPGGPPPHTSVKTSQKVDDRCVEPQVLRVIGPPSEKSQDPLLLMQMIADVCSTRLYTHGK